MVRRQQTLPRHQAIAMRRSMVADAQRLKRVNADTRLSFGKRYAAIVARDVCLEAIEALDNFLREFC